jgi:hypothetical protein
LTGIVPGGAKKALTARPARALLADVPAGDVVRATRRQLAAELAAELGVIDGRIKTAKKQLAALVAETSCGIHDTRTPQTARLESSLLRSRRARCERRPSPGLDPAPASAARSR